MDRLTPPQDAAQQRLSVLHPPLGEELRTKIAIPKSKSILRGCSEGDICSLLPCQRGAEGRAAKNKMIQDTGSIVRADGRRWGCA